jgi:hypothetical protein
MKTRSLFALTSALLLASTSQAQYAGPDGFGYASIPRPLDFFDISATGTNAGLSGMDDGGVIVPIGFSFDLYGTQSTNIGLSTNGYLADHPDLVDFSNDCPIPSAIDPDRAIFPFWDDLSLVDHGAIYYQTFGSAPNRVFVAQWEDVGTFDDSNAHLTFQAKLFESGAIEFHYQDLTSAPLFDASGGSTSVGLENSGGTIGLQVYCIESGALASGDAIHIRRVNARLSGPAVAAAGSSFVLNGQGPASAGYVIAFSLIPGQTPAIPLLANMSLNILPPFTFVGIGLTSPSGAFTSLPVAVPPTAPCGIVGYFQGVTFTAFGPAGDSMVTNVVAVNVTRVLSATGSIAGPFAGDHYTFSGQVGDVVTIEECRTDNTGIGTSTLDPFLCLIAPSGGTEAFNDDGAGDCEVPGPFGASIITNHTLAETGIYTIIASSFQGLGGELGDYVLRLTGCTGTNLALAVDEGPNCP